MPTERISFPGHDGAMLAARLDAPARGARAYALFAHCFTCGKDIAAARRIAARLTEAGVAVLRFDFTGLGHSQGEFANTTFSSNVRDLLAAAAWLRAEREAPQLLVGHSLGGAAALAAAAEIPELRAVASLAAPYDPAHVLHNFGSDLETVRREGEAEVSLAGRPFRIKRGFIEDVERTKIDAALGAMKKALLVMHAPRDATVGVENATDIFIAAKHPKSFVSLDDADHLITRDADAVYAADVIAAWAQRYIELTPEAHPGAGAGEGAVRSAEASPNGFLQDVHAGGHHLLADEPASVGGTDLGPTPYQLVAAGLASCTAMTVRMVARRKGMALDHVTVDVRHDKVHAADCEACETREGRIDQFERMVRLDGALSEEERAKLLEIADKCPVHRTLERSSSIVTTLAPRE
ncbi:MAG: bifunctional alpha/beta hydrolase/OsmC family protein [Pseudomonadota bacterium]